MKNQKNKLKEGMTVKERRFERKKERKLKGKS